MKCVAVCDLAVHFGLQSGLLHFESGAADLLMGVVVLMKRREGCLVVAEEVL